jgi:ATP-dependent 26S proteasome regulatory subunit
MADTRNRGKVLWFLITARPDLLPVDLKRQGRAEEHIPLFYPETVGEVDEIFRVMKKKLRLATTVESLVGLVADERLLGLSGSDLEAILVRAILEAESAERSEVTADDLKRAFDDFLPATSARERELQILAGVLECTSRELLPEKYKSMDRSELATRISDLKRELRAG